MVSVHFSRCFVAAMSRGFGCLRITSTNPVYMADRNIQSFESTVGKTVCVMPPQGKDQCEADASVRGIMYRTKKSKIHSFAANQVC